MLYQVSQRYHFSELSRSVPAGAQVYLPDEVAARYLTKVPGLLRPIANAMGAPEMVRAAPAELDQAPSQAETPAEKPKRGRKKKA